MAIFSSVGIIYEIILTLFAENTEMSGSQKVKVEIISVLVSRIYRSVLFNLSKIRSSNRGSRAIRSREAKRTEPCCFGSYTTGV